jgi:hypothetical protein
MSARQLLSELDSLPPDEQRKFFAELNRRKRATAPSSATPPDQVVEWPDVEARAKAITGGRVLLNPVLLEREESDR